MEAPQKTHSCDDMASCNAQVPMGVVEEKDALFLVNFALPIL